MGGFGRLGKGDGYLAGNGLGVVIERLLTQIGHGGPRYGNECSGAWLADGEGWGS
ncbi:hypothetical protein D3C71_2063890 [compost metagenome]